MSSVSWTGDHSLITSSWDHSLRIWDADIGGMSSQINGNTAFFTTDWSNINKTVLATCADRHIRLYDPRATGKLRITKFICNSHNTNIKINSMS